MTDKRRSKYTESEDHDKTKRYMAYVSGGHVEVIGPDDKKFDATSFSYRVIFEYERHRKNFRNDAEKLMKIVKDNIKRILVVPDSEKDKAMKDLGKDFPDVEVYSKSEIESLNPAIFASLIEDLMRGRKEFRINRQIILRSDKPPVKKAIELIQNRREHRRNRRRRLLGLKDDDE